MDVKIIIIMEKRTPSSPAQETAADCPNQKLGRFYPALSPRLKIQAPTSHRAVFCHHQYGAVIVVVVGVVVVVLPVVVAAVFVVAFLVL